MKIELVLFLYCKGYLDTISPYTFTAVLTKFAWDPGHDKSTTENKTIIGRIQPKGILYCTMFTTFWLNKSKHFFYIFTLHFLFY